MTNLSWIALIFAFAVTLTGCYDSRYDQCEKDHPDTHSYRLCVQKFQNEDADDAALATTTITMAAAATTQ